MAHNGIKTGIPYKNGINLLLCRFLIEIKSLIFKHHHALNRISMVLSTYKNNKIIK